MRHIAVVHTLYYTDPACPWSWAFEPSFRRLLWEFGDSLEVRYVMSGMGHELEDGRRFALEALEAGAHSGMPVDARLWLDQPPTGSHPAAIAVLAAADQGLAEPYLRRLREGLFARRRKLDHGEALLEEGRAVAGLNLERFRIDLRSHATLEAFGADLEHARAVDLEHRADGAERVRLPSLEFRGDDGVVHGVYGYSDYETVKAAVLRAAAGDEAGPPTIEQALIRFSSMATAEVAAVCRIPRPPAAAELWRLATEWRIKAEPVGAGELWSLAAGA